MIFTAQRLANRSFFTIALFYLRNIIILIILTFLSWTSPMICSWWSPWSARSSKPIPASGRWSLPRVLLIFYWFLWDSLNHQAFSGLACPSSSEDHSALFSKSLCFSWNLHSFSVICCITRLAWCFVLRHHWCFPISFPCNWQLCPLPSLAFSTSTLLVFTTLR